MKGNKMKYVVSRLNPNCVCSLNCPNKYNEYDVNEGCLSRLLMLDDNNEPIVFNNIKEAYKQLCVHISEEELIFQLFDSTISIDILEDKEQIEGFVSLKDTLATVVDKDEKINEKR